MASELEDSSSDSSDSSIELREPKKKAKKNSIKRPAAKSVNSPLNVGNNSQPETPITTTPFTGENYLSWSRSIRTALTAKSQQGFLYGSIKCPSDAEDRVRWVKADSLVRSWILDSLSKEIKQDFVHIETTLELWEGLKVRYQVKNALSSYQLQKDINSLKQGNSSLEQYFSKMKSWWDEFRCINPLPRCDCKNRFNKCCIISDQVEEQDVKKCLTQFLTGLNDSYDLVRTVILGLEMPLDINQTYSFLLSFQKSLQINEVDEEHGDVSAMSFRDLESNAYKQISGNKRKSWNEQKNTRGESSKSSLVCTHCNMTGHLQEGCIKFIGCPEWFKKSKEQKGKKYSNRAATPFYLEEKKTKQKNMSKEAIFMETKNTLTSVMKQMNQNGDSEASTSKTIKFQNEVAETRNWIEDLPCDVTMAILQKVGSIDILENVQKVCVSWRKICQDPALWRSIDMNSIHSFYEMPYDLIKMTKHAIDRSCGQLIDINLKYYCDDDLVKYITDRKNQLRCLRLGSCWDITNEGLSEAAKKMPSMEVLQIYDGNITAEGLENVGRSCPGLKSLTRNRPGSPVLWESVDGYQFDPDVDVDYHFDSNSEALAISRSMPELRHLSLIGNCITKKGLQAILDACPHLESLDLRNCSQVNLSGDLSKQCCSIKTLRGPNESTGDSDSELTIHREYYPYGNSNFFDNDDFTDDEYSYYDSFDYDDFYHPILF